MSTVTEVDREELRVWRKRLGKLERSGEIQAALAGTREIAARSPESSYPHLMLGELYLRNGDTEASVSAFREAWRVAPRKWKVVPRVARGMSAAGRDEEALGLLGSLDGTMAAGPLSVERARFCTGASGAARKPSRSSRRGSRRIRSINPPGTSG